LGSNFQNDTSFFGLSVVSGRVRDFDNGVKLRTALRKAVSQYNLSVRLTSQQNIYLCDIKDSDRAAVADLLRDHGVTEPDKLPPVLRHAIACPALPTCGQAITESERMMPALVAELQSALNELGLSEDVVHFRTSGCPNGCSRPYTAEIGIVGASVDMYTIYLGASPLGTRIGTAFAQNVKRGDIIPRLRPVLEYYRTARETGEHFGDFCHRIGVDVLRDATVFAAA
jgi:sulfite reductase (ferredoxin)